MKSSLGSIVTLFSSFVLSVACSGTPDSGSGDDGPGEANAGAAAANVDLPSAQATLEAAGANPDLHVLDGADSKSPDGILGDEKIRNGTVINGTDAIGRSVVELLAVVPGGIAL